MKKWVSNERIKQIKPYIIILVTVLLAEVFLFNISTWKTMSCKPIVLAEMVDTNEKGIYETEFTEIHGDVKNVNVNLTMERYDRAKVKVILTDAGDFYEYAMPEYEVVSGMKDDGYHNIYPFGEVNKLRVVVTVPEGTEGHIESIVINDNRPFDFKIIRVALLFAVFVFGYMIFTDCSVMHIPCIRGNKWQIGLTIAVMAVLLFMGACLTRSNPVCVASPWYHHKQYQELARSLQQGTVVIDDKPEAALLEKENPYDTSALLVEGIPFRMDYALYDGNYYAYFGIVPELLFYLPHYLILDKDLQNYMVVFFFYCMLVIGVFGTFWELIQRFAKKTPFVWYLILGTGVCLLSNYVFMLGRPDIYNVPIMGANAFAFLGSFCWMRSVWNGRHRGVWFALGSLAVACIVGCRPQMILYGIVLFGVLFGPRLLQKEWRQSLKVREILAFCLPFAVVGGIVFWYNLARFGSGFDFGATYSLTSNDMNNRGFNLSRVVRGLYSFLFQPPVIHASFPFLQSSVLEGNYMGKNIVEFCYGGIFATCPILLVLLYIPLGGYKKCAKEVTWLVAGLCPASLIIAIFDVNGAGVLQRYMSDMVFGFTLAAVIVLLELIGRYRDGSIYKWIAKTSYLAVLCSIAFAFMVFITSEDGICLQEYNPPLFHTIWSYFKF